MLLDWTGRERVWPPRASSTRCPDEVSTGRTRSTSPVKRSRKPESRLDSVGPRPLRESVRWSIALTVEFVGSSWVSGFLVFNVKAHGLRALAPQGAPKQRVVIP